MKPTLLIPTVYAEHEKAEPRRPTAREVAPAPRSYVPLDPKTDELVEALESEFRYHWNANSKLAEPNRHLAESILKSPFSQELMYRFRLTRDEFYELCKAWEKKYRRGAIRRELSKDDFEKRASEYEQTKRDEFLAELREKRLRAADARPPKKMQQPLDYKELDKRLMEISEEFNKSLNKLKVENQGEKIKNSRRSI